MTGLLLAVLTASSLAPSFTGMLAASSFSMVTIADFRSDPCGWIERVWSPLLRENGYSPVVLWGDADNLNTQRGMIRAEGTERRVITCAANTTGKTWWRAIKPFWILSTRGVVKNVIVSGGWDQYKLQIGAAVRSWHSQVGNFGRELKVLDGGAYLEVNPERYAVGINPDHPDKMRGHHSPEVWLDFDEGQVIAKDKPDCYNVALLLNPDRWHVAGNPKDTGDAFGELWHNGSADWTRVKLSALDCLAWQCKHGVIPGLVTEAAVEEMARKWGEASAYYRSGVLGEFPLDDPDAIIRLSWVDAAYRRQVQGERRYMLACDVARKDDGDRTVIGGGRWTYKHLDVAQGRSIPATADRLKSLADACDPSGCEVRVDVTGLGVGVADCLDRLCVGTAHLVTRFGFGEGSVSGDFADKPSEAWFDAGKLLEAGTIAIEPDQYRSDLSGELTTRKWDAGAKRPKVQSKESWQTALGRGSRRRSPDHADAFVMWSWRGESGNETIEIPLAETLPIPRIGAYL